MGAVTKDFPDEFKDLLGKFNIWREESQRDLLHIINAYNKRVNDGFDYLIEELHDMQTKQSTNEDNEDREESRLIDDVLEVNVGSTNINAERAQDPDLQILDTEAQDEEEKSTTHDNNILNDPLSIEQTSDEEPSIKEDVTDILVIKEDTQIKKQGNDNNNKVRT